MGNAAASSCDGSVAKIPLQRVLANDRAGQQAAADFPNSFRSEQVQAQVSKAMEEKSQKPAEKQDTNKRERSAEKQQDKNKDKESKPPDKQEAKRAPKSPSRAKRGKS